jgi:methionyl-tRNA formyltransferase
MRILFMGSPELAVPSLRVVRETGPVVGVITQPPRASGRGRRLTPSPISREAGQWGIEVMTPETLRTPEIKEALLKLKPDIAVVMAYGKILPPDILAVPKLGCVNVHTSILPELRGAAPIQWAIARGYKTTGVTLMQMDAGMDTGPILLQKTTAIGPEETAGELGARLAQMGADLLQEGLPLIERGELLPIEQDNSRATYAPLLTKADGLIDWSLPAEEIANRVRGFSPWPGTYTTRGGSRLLVTRARALEEENQDTPGRILSAQSGGIQVACGSGRLYVLAVKPEGKREMEISEFLAGHKVEPGEILGEEAVKDKV